MSEKLDYNIELAHIYVNEDVTREQYQALDIAKDKIFQLDFRKKTFATAIMIDDYNPNEWTLDVKKFLAIFKGSSLKVDYVIYESKLTKYKDQLLSEMSPRLNKQYSKYISEKGKCPCSFLIAAWYLVRFGIYDNHGVFLKHPLKKPLAAKNIITVLPQRYESVEKKALEIIYSTPHKKMIEGKIEHVFF